MKVNPFLPVLIVFQDWLKHDKIQWWLLVLGTSSLALPSSCSDWYPNV